MEMTDVIEHFLLDVQVKSRTRNTLVSYRHHLKFLSTFLAGSCKVVDLEKVTVTHLRQCVQYLLTNKVLTHLGNQPVGEHQLAISSIRGYVRVWKAFFNWCYQEELIEKNPVTRLSLPKPEQKLIVTFTTDHITKMLATFDTSTDLGFRDYVILLLLLDTGMRLCEIVRMQVTDVHDTYVKVYGKGRKEREIGIHPEVGKLVWKYIHKYRHAKDSDEMGLFLGFGKPLTKSGVHAIMERIKRLSGLEGVRVSAHTFRHTFAKLYLERGGELFKLSRELGHSSIEITQVYLEDFGSTEARKDHTAFSPVSMLDLKKRSRRKKQDE